MTIAYYIVIAFHVIACLFLIGVVLLQQGKGQDLASAFGGAGSQTAFGARGTATLLSKITAAAAAIFMITSLTLSFLRPAVGPRTVVPETAPPAETGAPPPASEETEAPAPGPATPETAAPQGEAQGQQGEAQPGATSTTPQQPPK